MIRYRPPPVAAVGDPGRANGHQRPERAPLAVSRRPPWFCRAPAHRNAVAEREAVGPAQSWNLRTVPMPFWMMSKCSTQMTTWQITSRPGGAEQALKNGMPGARSMDQRV